MIGYGSAALDLNRHYGFLNYLIRIPVDAYSVYVVMLVEDDYVRYLAVISQSVELSLKLENFSIVCNTKMSNNTIQLRPATFSTMCIMLKIFRRCPIFDRLSRFRP